MALRFGASTVPMTGWLVNGGDPASEQERHLWAFRSLVTDYGVKILELAADFATVFPSVMNRGFYERVADLQQELGFGITNHLPFFWIDPASLNETARRASVTSIREAAEAMAPLQIETYVLHLWGAWSSAAFKSFPTVPADLLLTILLATGERSLAEVLEFLPAASVCLENLEGISFYPLAPIAQRNGCRICLDIGHVAWLQEDPLAIVRQYGNLLGQLHIHDVTIHPDGKPHDHLPLGEGTRDLPGIFAALESQGFGGPVVIENNYKEDLIKSLAYLA
ncbi:MAG: sugar phosphate isomerase/epimerase [Chloroflexi bacterium]|nr:sugar phosphate isomerase/epimerase [Chloroflexota bacterium]